MDSLLPKPRLIRVARDTRHPVIYHIRRVRDRVAPERRPVNHEVPHGRALRVRERERDGAAVAVEARRVAVPRPPALAVADDAARAVCVEREVVAREDEPGGLRLDEDDAEGRRGIHPVLEVEDKLSSWATRYQRKDRRDGQCHTHVEGAVEVDAGVGEVPVHLPDHDALLDRLFERIGFLPT